MITDVVGYGIGCVKAVWGLWGFECLYFYVNIISTLMGLNYMFCLFVFCVLFRKLKQIFIYSLLTILFIILKLVWNIQYNSHILIFTELSSETKTRRDIRPAL